MGEGSIGAASALVVPKDFAAFAKSLPQDIRRKMSVHQLRHFWERERDQRERSVKLLENIVGYCEDLEDEARVNEHGDEENYYRAQRVTAKRIRREAGGILTCLTCLAAEWRSQ